jgi:hypothetical protein
LVKRRLFAQRGGDDALYGARHNEERDRRQRSRQTWHKAILVRGDHARDFLSRTPHLGAESTCDQRFAGEAAAAIACAGRLEERADGTRTVTNNYNLKNTELSTTDTQTTTNSYALNSAALTGGTPAWSNASLLETSATAATAPAVGFDANGDGFALWQVGSDLFVQRYTRTNNTWATAQILDTKTTTISTPQLYVDASENRSLLPASERT